MTEPHFSSLLALVWLSNKKLTFRLVRAARAGAAYFAVAATAGPIVDGRAGVRAHEDGLDQESQKHD